jgi:Zn-dependent protease
MEQNVLPWWWPHLTVSFFCLIAIVLGSLDHFLANDRWGVGIDLALIGAGLTGGGVVLGHAWALPQSLSRQ